LRPPLFYSPYEAAAWAVLSARRPARQIQQIRQRLSEAHGEVFELAGERLAAFPSPRQLLSVPSFPGVPQDKIRRLHGVAQGRLTSLRFSHAELLEQINQAHQNQAVLQENLKQAGESHNELLQKIDEAKQALALTQRQHAEVSKQLVEAQSRAAVKETPVLQPPVAKEEPKAETPPPAPPVEPDLPLVKSHPGPPIAASWDSYVLESEFFTEETLDASRIAELVTNLPGIEHSLIIQQFGPVLADRLPQRLHTLFQVPRRDYALLYDRLPNKVKDYPNLPTRLSTYQIGDEFLTLSGAKDVFLAVTHEAPMLRPGLPEKIATVAEELGKMYPAGTPAKA
jgi:hypothetical protein